MAQNVYFGAAIFGRIRPGQNFGFQKGIVTKLGGATEHFLGIRKLRFTFPS